MTVHTQIGDFTHFVRRQRSGRQLPRQDSPHQVGFGTWRSFFSRREPENRTHSLDGSRRPAPPTAVTVTGSQQGLVLIPRHQQRKQLAFRGQVVIGLVDVCGTEVLTAEVLTAEVLTAEVRAEIGRIGRGCTGRLAGWRIRCVR